MRAALVDFAKRIGAPQPTVSAVELAASEAATNVVLHAYRDGEGAGEPGEGAGEPGVIQVEAALAGTALSVVVADVGSGLKPRPNSPGLGLGLGIIAQVTDDFELVPRAAGGLELRMHFVIAR